MNQDKIREFVAEYKHKEKLLAKSMELLGRITDATQEQDMHEHWDFEIGIPIDVKAMKKSSRMEDKPNDCYHWIEIMNLLTSYRRYARIRYLPQIHLKPTRYIHAKEGLTSLRRLRQST